MRVVGGAQEAEDLTGLALADVQIISRSAHAYVINFVHAPCMKSIVFVWYGSSEAMSGSVSSLMASCFDRSALKTKFLHDLSKLNSHNSQGTKGHADFSYQQ